MSTFGLAGTQPLADFAVDPEDLIYTWIGTNWSITSPTHIDKENLFLTTNPTNMLNRPEPGNRSIWFWVRHNRLESGRNLFGSTIGTKGMIMHFHTFDIHILTTRLVQGLTFPDLGQIIRETERILYQCTDGQIEGIQQFNSFNVFPLIEAQEDWGEAFAGMYRATCQTTAQYQKHSSV